MVFKRGMSTIPKMNVKRSVSVIVLFVLFLAALNILILHVSPVLAGGTTVGPHHTVEINAHNQCRRVTNNHATSSIWVPHQFSEEWNSFILNHPNFVTLASCDPCAGVTCPEPTAWTTCYPQSECAGVMHRGRFYCSGGNCLTYNETAGCATNEGSPCGGARVTCVDNRELVCYTTCTWGFCAGAETCWHSATPCHP